MKLSDFKRVNGGSDEMFTLFVSTDGGQTWARSVARNVLAGVTGPANDLMAQRKITHYVVARGEWEA